MNPELQKELLKWLTELHDAADKGAGFVGDQAPKVAAEMVALGRVETTVILLSALVVGATALACFRGSFVWDWRKMLPDVDHEAAQIGTCVVSLFAWIISIAVVACNLHSVAAVWFAPRIYIIEQLAGLLGKAAGK